MLWLIHDRVDLAQSQLAKFIVLSKRVKMLGNRKQLSGDLGDEYINLCINEN